LIKLQIEVISHSNIIYLSLSTFELFCINLEGIKMGQN